MAKRHSRAASPHTRSGAAAPRSSSGDATSPSGTPRAGRRGRDRIQADRRPFIERQRGPLVMLGAIAIVALVGGFLFVQTTQKAYACESLLQPAAAATPGPGASAAPLGQVADDLGRLHTTRGNRVTYAYCPPASGAHYSDPPDGPIPSRFYAKDEATLPEGWVHNLEHGGMVVLYNCATSGCDDASLAALRAFVESQPPTPLCGRPDGVVVTRFDDMAAPIAAIVWDRVLFQSKVDVGAIRAFYGQYADRGPEPQCQQAAPGASPAPSPMVPGASTVPAGSAAPVASTAPAGSAAPSASAAP